MFGPKDTPYKTYRFDSLCKALESCIIIFGLPLQLNIITFVIINVHYVCYYFSIKKGRFDEAEQSLLKMFGSEYDAKQDVITISENLQHLRNVTLMLINIQT